MHVMILPFASGLCVERRIGREGESIGESVEPVRGTNWRVWCVCYDSVLLIIFAGSDTVQFLIDQFGEFEKVLSFYPQEHFTTTAETEAPSAATC